MRRVLLALVMISVLAASAVAVHAESLSIDTLKSVLKDGRIDFKQIDKNTLEFNTGFSDGKPYHFMVRIDERSKFLYLAVTDLARLSATDKNFCAKVKILLNLNYGIALSKLEWEERSGEIRLSNSFATERNLKKEDLLFTIQMLLSTAEKLQPQLSKLGKD